MEAVARRLAAPVFALALFFSAALTFLLQPMVGRLATPLLGGSPAVWNTTMAFFQAALLIGYLYAHALAKLKDLRVQALAHALVLALAWLALPIHLSDALGPPSSSHPAFWLLGVLTLSVGAPFAVASATAPLLQAWFARTGRADAGDPYYLYAASNLGSFTGLLAYPALMEPNAGLAAQGVLWAAGFVGAAALVCLAGATAIGAHGTAPALARGPALTWRQRLSWAAAAAIPSSLILGVTQHISTDIASAPFLWVAPLALYLLTFVLAFSRRAQRIEPWVLIAHPLSLAFLAASYYWRTAVIGPLAANLLCFFLSALVCHFMLSRTRPQAGRLTEFYLWLSIGGVAGGAATALIAPVVFNDVYEYPLALAAAALLRPAGTLQMRALANASVASAAAMTAIVAMLLMRTPADAVLFAGGFGGAAALLAAALPMREARGEGLQVSFLVCALVLALAMTLVLVKPDVLITHAVVGGYSVADVHYPLGLALVALAFLVIAFCVHSALQPRFSHPLATEAALGVAAACLTLLVMLLLKRTEFREETVVRIAIAFAAAALFLNRARPRLLAVLVLAAFAIVFIDDRVGGRVLSLQRSFFGVLRTEEHIAPAPGTTLRVLMHGTTIHGAQLHGAPEIERRPLTYYSPNTALGEAVLAGLSGGTANSLALIGMGAGTTACLMSPQDRLTVFEIDRKVVRLSAERGGLFTYIPDCQPHARIVLGDGRLSIARERDRSFDVILVDAFSSDAVPAHLLTEEAIALYLRKTSARGIVILHLSNRNLALVSEAVRVAHALNAPFLWRASERRDDRAAGIYGAMGASVMILAHDPQTLARLALASNDWHVLPTPPGRPWTDDYINLPRALYDNLNGREECLQSERRIGCASPRP